MTADTLIQDWVTYHAGRRPEAVALVMSDGQTHTYAQIEVASNRLAHMLKGQGCQPGDRICFLMPKGISAFIALLGILKADCAYVPIDASGPAARAAKILMSCRPRFLLGDRSTAGLVDELLAEPQLTDAVLVGWLDDAGSFPTSVNPRFSAGDLSAFPDTPPKRRNARHDLAYILFTSGSTGMPKGVMISHHNVICFIDWANRYFGVTPQDRLSSHAPLHFDLSVLDVYSALHAGAQLHLVSPELSLLPNKLVEFIRTRELTQWVSVPSLLSYIAKFGVIQENDFPTLKRLIWCGETFPTPSLIYWMKRLPHVQFTNLYGPTETTCASSYYTIPACPEDASAAIPIGMPCEGEELLVLDEKLKPVPMGVKGDLFIAGVGLSTGYWGDPEKTKSAFLPDPRNPGSWIYKTGDLGSVGHDQLFYMHGRADFQVKSRGYRIELGEIEAALSGMPELREAVIVATSAGGFEGATICCAYELNEGKDLTSIELKKRLGRVLPSYMIPARWLKYETIPRNANHKIDRRLIADRFEQSVVESDKGDWTASRQ